MVLRVDPQHFLGQMGLMLHALFGNFLSSPKEAAQAIHGKGAQHRSNDCVG